MSTIDKNNNIKSLSDNNSMLITNFPELKNKIHLTDSVCMFKGCISLNYIIRISK